MNRPTLDLNPAYERCSPARNWILFNVLSPLFRSSKVRRPPMDLAVKPQDEAGIGAAKSSSVFDERLKHRLKIEGGSADHLKDLACRSLLFQGFSEIAVTFLQFLEQPHILDSDYGLVGEGRDQLNLLICERPDRLSPDHDHSNGDTFPEHGSSKYGPEPTDFLSLGPLIIGVRQNIVNMNRPSF